MNRPLDGHQLQQIGEVVVLLVNECAYGYDDDEGVLFEGFSREVAKERLLAEKLVAELERVGYKIVRSTP